MPNSRAESIRWQDRFHEPEPHEGLSIRYRNSPSKTSQPRVGFALPARLHITRNRIRRHTWSSNVDLALSLLLPLGEESSPRTGVKLFRSLLTTLPLFDDKSVTGTRDHPSGGIGLPLRCFSRASLSLSTAEREAEPLVPRYALGRIGYFRRQRPRSAVDPRNRADVLDQSVSKNSDSCNSIPIGILNLCSTVDYNDIDEPLTAPHTGSKLNNILPHSDLAEPAKRCHTLTVAHASPSVPRVKPQSRKIELILSVVIIA